MDILTTILTSAAGGGATGLLGLLVTAWGERNKRAHELDLTRLQLEAADKARAQELAAQERMADKAQAAEALQRQLELQGQELQADQAAYAASMASDRATFIPPEALTGERASWPVRWIITPLLGLVDVLRGLMRPAITGYSLGLLTLLGWWLQGLFLRTQAPMLTATQLHELAVQVVGTVIYLATTTTVWWFGVRPAQPAARR